MTAQVKSQSSQPGIFAGLGAALVGAFTFLAENSRGARAQRAAQALFALSDEELAARGIRRSEILSRTFGPSIHL
jgi:hypothetical protein